MAVKKTTKPKEDIEMTTEEKAKVGGDLYKRLKDLSTFSRQEKILKSGLISLDMLASGEIDYKENIGFFAGKLYGITGESGIGKSTLIADLLRRFCQQGYKCLICDYEEGFNQKSIKDFGLDEFIAYDIADFISGAKSLLIINPVTFGDTASTLYEVIEKNKVKVDVVLIDSIKKIQSQFLEENIEKMENLPMGMRARKLGDLLPFLKTLFGKYGILGFCINHMSVKMNQYGGFDAESSNKAYLENMDVRFILKRRDKGMLYMKVIDQNNDSVDKPIGNWIEINSSKSRVGNTVPLYLPIRFGKGVSTVYQYTNLLLANSIVKGGERSNSRVELTEMIADMKNYDIETKGFPEFVSGEAGLRDFIKNNNDVVETYLIKKNLFSIEKS